MEQKIAVIIADDHEVFRDGINALFTKQPHISLVAEASNGEQLMQLIPLHNPDVILMDIKMPKMNGIEATRLISEKHPHIGVIALSMYNEQHLVTDMIDAGASGYLTKNAPKHEIMEAIKSVSRSNTYYPGAASRIVANHLKSGRVKKANFYNGVRFSENEKAVLRMICMQYSTNQIADKMHLAPRTIEKYRERLLKKTGSTNMAGMVVFAMKHNIFEYGDN